MPCVSLHADRLTHVAQRHRHLDRLVHGDLLEVDVDQVLGDGVDLEVADDGHPRLAGPGEGHVEQLRAALVAVDEAEDFPRVHGDVDGSRAPVEDAGVLPERRSRLATHLPTPSRG